MRPFNRDSGPSPKQLLDAELDAGPADWLYKVPEPGPGEPELTAAQLAEYMPPINPQYVGILKDIRDRQLPQGVVVAPDSAPYVPPDLLGGADPERVMQLAIQREAEQPERDKDKAGLLPHEREVLETGGPAGQALLTSLEEEDGISEEEDKEVRAVLKRRLGEMGLSEDYLEASGGAVFYPFRRAKRDRRLFRHR